MAFNRRAIPARELQTELRRSFRELEPLRPMEAPLLTIDDKSFASVSIDIGPPNLRHLLMYSAQASTGLEGISLWIPPYALKSKYNPIAQMFTKKDVSELWVYGHGVQRSGQNGAEHTELAYLYFDPVKLTVLSPHFIANFGGIRGGNAYVYNAIVTPSYSGPPGYAKTKIAVNPSGPVGVSLGGMVVVAPVEHHATLTVKGPATDRARSLLTPSYHVELGRNLEGIDESITYRVGWPHPRSYEFTRIGTIAQLSKLTGPTYGSRHTEVLKDLQRRLEQLA